MSTEIVINSDDENFRTLLLKMMGRGLQTSIEKSGHFLLSLEDLQDLVQRIRQRVAIQNQCIISDYYAEFTFQDGSRDKVPSIDNFEQYRSTNSNVCIKAKISMAFIVKFNNRGAEKQTIDIEFSAPDEDSSVFKRVFNANDIEDRIGNSKISIEYTDITWANDIKNLFLEYVNAHFINYPYRIKIARMLNSKTLYSLGFPAILVLSTIVLSLKETNNNKYKEIVSRIDNSVIDKIEKINLKLNSIIMKENMPTFLSDIIYPIFIFGILLIICFFCLFLAVNVPRSAILLSVEARKRFDNSEKATKKGDYFAIGAIITAILCSVFANNINAIFEFIYKNI